MVKLLREITPELARNAYRHLSHFAALNAEKQLADQLWEHIVLEALVHVPGARFTEVSAKITEVFGLELDEFEVQSILARLVRHRKVREAKGRISKFFASPELVQQIQSEWKESRELESRVLEQWGTDLRRRHSLSDEDITQLKSDIRDFLTIMLRQYGADCAKLTGIGAPQEVQRVVGGALDHALAALPPVTETIQQLRIRELPLFFVSGDDDRHEFIRQMTQAMYVLFAVEIDPDLSTLLVSNYAGGNVLLDTNLAYSLLGLDGPQMEKAMSALIKYSRALGYEPVLTQKTVEELNQIVKGRLSELQRASRDPSPAYMQQVLDDHSYADDVFKAYYRSFLLEYRKSGRKLTRDAFALTFQHPEEIIVKQYQVQILAEEHDWVAEQTERLNDLTEKIMSASAHRPDGGKGYATAEHDAYNYMLTQRLRAGTTPKRFVDAKAWLVTNDRTLLIADGRCLKSSDLPNVILAESWMQMARLSLPRSINGDAGFANLLAAPYLRNAQIPSRVADMIGGYLALESTTAPEIQVRMLQDKMLTDRLQGATTDEIQIELDQAAARIAAEEAERRLEAERLLEEQTQVAEAKVAQAQELTQRVQAEAAQKDALSQVNQDLQRRIAALEAQEAGRRKQEAEHKRLEQERMVQRAKTRRYVGCSVMVMVLIAFGATSPLWRTWPGLYRAFLGCGVALVLAVSVLLIDKFLGVKHAFLRWLPWTASNVAIVFGGYGLANLFSNQDLSSTVVTLSVIASLLANPVSGLYLPMPSSPTSPPQDEAA